MILHKLLKLHSQLISRDTFSFVCRIIRENKFNLAILICLFPAALIIAPALFAKVSLAQENFIATPQHLSALLLLSGLSTLPLRLFSPITYQHFNSSMVLSFPLTKFYWFCLRLLHDLRIQFVCLVSLLVALVFVLCDKEAIDSVRYSAALNLVLTTIFLLWGSRRFFNYRHWSLVFSAFFICYALVFSHMYWVVAVIFIMLESVRRFSFVKNVPVNLSLWLALDSNALLFSCVCIFLSVWQYWGYEDSLTFVNFTAISLTNFMLCLSVGNIAKFYRMQRWNVSCFPNGRHELLRFCVPSFAAVTVSGLLLNISFALFCAFTPIKFIFFASFLLGLLCALWGNKLLALSQVIPYVIILMWFFN